MIAQLAPKGFTSLGSWENDLLIWLLPLSVLRPLLSLDSHGSAMCSTIQGSFHVPVTLLEPRYGIARQPPPSPFQVLLFIPSGWWSPALAECVFISDCLHACLYESIIMCCLGDRCALRHVHVCVHTRVCVRCVHVCVCSCCCSLHPQMGLCLFVSTYISAYSEHSLSESEAVRTHFQPTVLPRCLSAEQ